MKELIITNELIQRIMEDTGSSREMADGIAKRLSGLSPTLREAAAKWACEYMSDKELSEIKAGDVSLLDIMNREEKRFVEALFSLSVLEKDPELAKDYFRLFPNRNKG